MFAKFQEVRGAFGPNRTTAKQKHIPKVSEVWTKVRFFWMANKTETEEKFTEGQETVSIDCTTSFFILCSYTLLIFFLQACKVQNKNPYQKDPCFLLPYTKSNPKTTQALCSSLRISLRSCPVPVLRGSAAVKEGKGKRETQRRRQKGCNRLLHILFCFLIFALVTRLLQCGDVLLANCELSDDSAFSSRGERWETARCCGRTKYMRSLNGISECDVKSQMRENEE